MKKIISIFLSLCIVFSLSGCKNNNSNKKVIDVAGGNGYSILLTDTGEVYYSGSYLPKITDKREGIDPYGLDKIQITAKVKQIYAGMYSVLLISDTNEGYLMGRDFMNGSVTNLYPPVKIQLPGIVKDAAIGSYGITILPKTTRYIPSETIKKVYWA